MDWSKLRRELLAMAEDDLTVRAELAADGSLFPAIAQPALQRAALRALQDAAARGEVPPLQPAMLEDRIRTFEGRPQLYGTQFDWDAAGELSPLPIEDLTRVEERRRAVGLGPLVDDLIARRRAAAEGPEQPPTDWAERQRDMEAWLRTVGWRA